MTGRVVVDNNTGHAIRARGCLTLFQVALVSGAYQSAVAWPLCLQTFTIPIGESSYRVAVGASYRQCHQGRPHGTVRACLPDGQPPPLPPGDYHAMLFQAGHLVPVSCPRDTAAIGALAGRSARNGPSRPARHPRRFGDAARMEVCGDEP